MAIVNVTKDIVRTITLTSVESDYLAGLLQNYLGEGEEPSAQVNIRSNLYHCVSRDITGEVEYK